MKAGFHRPLVPIGIKSQWGHVRVAEVAKGNCELWRIGERPILHKPSGLQPNITPLPTRLLGSLPPEFLGPWVWISWNPRTLESLTPDLGRLPPFSFEKNYEMHL